MRKTAWYETTIVHRKKEYPAVQCRECGLYFCDVINVHSILYKYCPYCGKRVEKTIRGTKNEC